MSVLQYTSTDVQVVKRWSNALSYDTIADDTLVGNAIKKGIITKKDELGKGPGDNVKFHLRRRQSGRGLRGEQSATGNEAAMAYDQDQLNIDLLRYPVQVTNKGSITTQRVTFDMPKDAYEVIRDWHIERQTVAFLNQIAGYTATSIIWDGETYTGTDRLNITGLNAAVAPSTANIIRANGTTNTTDQAVGADTAATLRFSMIDEAVSAARKNRPYIEKLDNGGINFMCYVHIDGFKQLIQDTTAPIQYRDIMLAKLTAGAKDEELIGETMVYNQTMIISTDKIPNGVNSGTSAAVTTARRAVFVGKEACAMAYGQGFNPGSGDVVAGFSFEQDFLDINLFKRISGNGIYGLKKTQYNSVDRGTIVLVHYAA